MGISEALEIVEKAKDTAEKIMHHVFKVNPYASLGECIKIEDRRKMINFLYSYETNCGYQRNYDLDIPKEVINNPTEENIKEFINAYEREEKEKKAKLAKEKRLAKEQAAIKAKQKRLENYQKLKAEFEKKENYYGNK